jgi:hypothetical protein
MAIHLRRNKHHQSIVCQAIGTKKTSMLKWRKGVYGGQENEAADEVGVEAVQEWK